MPRQLDESRRGVVQLSWTSSEIRLEAGLHLDRLGQRLGRGHRGLVFRLLGQAHGLSPLLEDVLQELLAEPPDRLLQALQLEAAEKLRELRILGRGIGRGIGFCFEVILLVIIFLNIS